MATQQTSRRPSERRASVRRVTPRVHPHSGSLPWGPPKPFWVASYPCVIDKAIQTAFRPFPTWREAHDFADKQARHG